MKNTHTQEKVKRQPKLAIKFALLASLIATLICAGVAVSALRANNEHMAMLRADVYAADKSGVGVPTALDNLQAYVTAHMNTNLSSGAGSVYPPIQLEYTYLRLVQAQDQIAQSSNSGLYTAAQDYCQKVVQHYFAGPKIVPCIENYVSTHGTLGTKLPTISPALYEFDFVSPSWSPDLAGWMLLATIFFATIALLLALTSLYRRFLVPASN